MIINSHAHFFNFALVNTSRARETLLNRLRDAGWQDYLVDIVKRVIDSLLEEVSFDEEKALRLLVKELQVDDRFKEVIRDAFGDILPEPIETLLEGSVDGLAVRYLEKALDKISERLSQREDIGTGDFEDVLGFLLIMLKPSAEDVAELYFDFRDDDHGAVALMMDITQPGDSDEEVFNAQARATADLTLAFPGRVFPFYAINPLRKNPLHRLEHAVEQEGFCGVKLYPSLGYDPFSDEMFEIYAYCERAELPILTHCLEGGFYFQSSDRQLAAPEGWANVLTRFPKLKICFGHFGGAENLAQANSVAAIKGWTKSLIDLARNHKGVYVDVSYHTAAMDGGIEQTKYFQNLAALLHDSTLQSRILWGSDYPLVRLRVREENYWAFFQRHLKAAEFRRMAQTNPRRFLGLPNRSGRGAKNNIQMHLNFLHRNNWAVKRYPVQWVNSALQANGKEPEFITNPFGRSFDYRNPAHQYAWQFGVAVLCDHNHSAWNRSFLQHAIMRLREFPRWPEESLADRHRQGRFKAFAMQMNKDLRRRKDDDGGGANYRNGISGRSAVNALQKQFENGNALFGDFGLLIESLYEFA